MNYIRKSIGAKMKSQKCECNYMLTDKDVNDTFDEPENNRFVHIVECPKCGKIKAYFEEKGAEPEPAEEEKGKAEKSKTE